MRSLILDLQSLVQHVSDLVFLQGIDLHLEEFGDARNRQLTCLHFGCALTMAVLPVMLSEHPLGELTADPTGNSDSRVPLRSTRCNLKLR